MIECTLRSFLENIFSITSIGILISSLHLQDLVFISVTIFLCFKICETLINQTLVMRRSRKKNSRDRGRGVRGTLKFAGGRRVRGLFLVILL